MTGDYDDITWEPIKAENVNSAVLVTYVKRHWSVNWLLGPKRNVWPVTLTTAPPTEGEWQITFKDPNRWAATPIFHDEAVHPDEETP